MVKRKGGLSIAGEWALVGTCHLMLFLLGRCWVWRLFLVEGGSTGGNCVGGITRSGDGYFGVRHLGD